MSKIIGIPVGTPTPLIASKIGYDGEEQWISATNVEEALKKTSDQLLQVVMDFSLKADREHSHEASEINFPNADIECVNVEDALNYIISQTNAVPQLFAGALKGKASGELVALCDVSPVRHSVGVEVGSKNLLPFPYTSYNGVVVNSKEVDGVTFTINDNGTITLNGTATATISFMLYYNKEKTVTPAGQTVTISEGETAIDGAMLYVNYLDSTGAAKDGLLRTDDKASSTKTIPSDWCGNSIFIRVNSGATFDNVVFKPQIEIGANATTYTPYIEDTSAVKVQVLGKNLANKAELIQMPESASRKYLDLYLQAGKYYYSSNLHSASGVTFWTGIVHEGEVTNQNNVQQFSTFSSSQDEGAFTIAEGGVYRFLIYCSTADICDTLTGAWDDVWIQIEQGNAKTEYEPYKAPVEYEQGEAIPSVSPVMTITTDTPGATVRVDYNRDINAAFETLTKAIISLGGNV